VFTRQPGTAIESQGDSLYLPLPASRIVSWIGPMNPGPVKLADGKSAYRYTFPDEMAREAVLSMLWPGSADPHKDLSPAVAKRIGAIVLTGHGPVVPIPAGLRRSLGELCPALFPREGFVPASALPQLYSVLGVLGKGKL